MPELPEVTTTVNGINIECTGWTINDVWTDLAVNKPSRIDFYQTIKYLPYFKNFAKIVKGKKIMGATRRGKNILIKLNSKETILIHMKMTGHMMVGNYEFKIQKVKVKNKIENIKSWTPSKDEKNLALLDPYNRFIHFVFTLTPPQPSPKLGQGEINKKIKHLVLCDTRKFAKIALLENEDHHKIHLSSHGPEPINPDISYKDFVKALDTAPANNRPIKILLMDTRTISGIRNIYSDEMLFSASIHPQSKWSKIPESSRKILYREMLKVLKKGIDFGGDSMSDYRNIYGMRGEFQNNHNAYRKTGSKCSKSGCSGTITRTVITGRSSHYCPTHQQIYK